MSWVQSNSPLQHQQQPQQQQPNPYMPTSHAPANNSASYMGKMSSSNTAITSSNSLRSQTHAIGTAPVIAHGNASQQQQQPQQRQHAQAHFNNHQQHWQQQQQPTFQQQNNMNIDPTVVPNWQQQQNMVNANIYQQQQQPQQLRQQPQQSLQYPPNNGLTQWPQPEEGVSTASYGSYYDQQAIAQQPTKQSPGNYYQQLGGPPTFQAQQSNQQAVLKPQQMSQQLQPLQQQQPQQQQHQPPNPNTNTNPKEFFDQGNNGNSATEGWSDWDWNDSSSADQQLQQPQQQPQQQIKQSDGQIAPQAVNASIIEDSFNTQGRDNWSWSMGEDSNANAVDEKIPTAASASPVPPQSLPLGAAPPAPLQPQSIQQQQQVPIGPNEGLTQLPPPNNNYQVPQSHQLPPPPGPGPASAHFQQPPFVAPKSVELTTATSKSSLAMKPNAAVKPTTLPLQDLHNENFNVASSAAVPPTNSGTNIPSPVYVSQAKPVSRPPRQFASPPDGNTLADSMEATLTPPEEFQNDSLDVDAPSTAATLPPPPMAMPMVPPPAMVPPVAVSSALSPPPLPAQAGYQEAVNPFKRTGAVQHHRSGLLANATTALSGPSMPSLAPQPIPAQVPSVATNNLYMPTAQIDNGGMLPDNSEVLVENQEIIGPSSLQQTLPQTITLPGASVVATPPPNDERNQYLQTSHLSENLEDELNVESDNLPPPGLSRLVLGQPELEANQRLVTGTEEPSSVPTANMHLEERHADGQDTPSEQLLGVGAMPNSVQRGGDGGISSSVTTAGSSTSTNIDITQDRNLYLVPGESNTADEQRRVVTGVETVGAIVPSNLTTQIRRDQREIELDGENLEDQQSMANATTNRNEPPLEGAASVTDPSIPSAVSTSNPSESVDMHYQAKSTKDHSNESTGNDESDPLEDHHHHHHHHQHQQQSRYAGKGGRRHGTEAEKKPSSDKRREKQLSVERYDSEDDSYPDNSSDVERDRHRLYREGSVRSEHGRDDRDRYREKKRRDGKRDSADEGEIPRDRYRGSDKFSYRSGEGDSKSERRSHRHNRYDAEMEDAIRHDSGGRNKEKSRRSGRLGGGSGAVNVSDDRGGRSDRSDRDYDDFQRHQHRSSKRDKDDDRRGYAVDDDRRDRRHRRDRDRERERERERAAEYSAKERRRREKVRGNGGAPGGDREYESYRKQSSRNAQRESDMEKERKAAGDMRYGPQMAAGMYGYPMGLPYDYSNYLMYYEQLSRNDPHMSEYLRKYYAAQSAAGGGAAATSAAAAAASASLGVSIGAGASGLGGSSTAATDGRESVHSGRSSAHNEKDRYTQAFVSQANEYHRHFHQHQQHQHQRQRQQQYHQQQLAAYNQSMNSTMLDDARSDSSAQLPLRSARSSSNLSQIHPVPSISELLGAPPYYAGGGVGGGAPAVIYYARSEYADSRSGNLSMRDLETDPQRSTPQKFPSEHAVVSLSAGLMVTVKPKYSPDGSVTNLVKLLRMGVNDATLQLFQSYPGPLVRGQTHKKTVIEFCEEQIRLGPSETTIYVRQLVSGNIDKYRPSYALMWNLLILLLRQNGMVVGTDIAELLLKNQQQFPYQSYAQRSPPSTAPNLSIASEDSAEEKDKGDDQSEEAAEAGHADDEHQNQQKKISSRDGDYQESSSKSEAADSTVSHSKSGGNSGSTLTEPEITEKFRNYLLYGNVSEALDWATDNNLWGHALFLASKMDRRSHANVMMKFANKLALNDPLQTLYQLMSGRSPSSVTSVQDEKWGDWRPHLSMILSNTSQKPELDRKAITTLGDSLFIRGDLYAAHFCYLMAQVGFGRYQETATQESTLQQSLPRLVLLGSSHYKKFNEFARNEAIMMTEIYEYACSLNDEKFSLVEFQPYKYLLASRMLDYGFHLKTLMYMEQISVHMARDPSKYESSFVTKVYELADRLKYYDPVLEKTVIDDHQQGDDNNLNGSMQQFEEQKWLQDLRSLAAQNQIDYTASTSYGGYDQTQSGIDAQFMEINKQFSQLNSQYKSTNMSEGMYGSADASQPPATVPDYGQQQQQQEQQQHHPQEEQGHQYDQQQQQQQPHSMFGGEPADPYAANNYAQNYAQPSDGQQQQQQPAPNSFYDPTQHQQSQGAQPTFYGGQEDYWASQQHQLQQQQQQQHQEQPTMGYGEEPNNFHRESETTETSAIASSSEARTNDVNKFNKNYDKSLKAKGANGSASRAVAELKETLEKCKLEQQQQQQRYEKNLRLYENSIKASTLPSMSAATMAASASMKSSRNFENNLNSTRGGGGAGVGVGGTTKILNDVVAYNLIHQQQQEEQQRQQRPKSEQDSKSPETENSSVSSMQPSGTIGAYSSPFTADVDSSRPTISMPKSKTYDSDDEAEKRKHHQQQQQQHQQLGHQNDDNSKQKQQQQRNNKNDTGSKGSQQNSGWFGGIWNKLSLKPKNQMILPDDKNPAIVWDPEKKRWVNTDGDEAAEETLKPPPKMSDIMPQVQPMMQQPPQSQPQAHQAQPQAQAQAQYNQQQQPQQPQQQLQSHPPQSTSPLMDTSQFYGGMTPNTIPAGIPPAPSGPASGPAVVNEPASAAPTSAAGGPGDAPKQPRLQSNMFKMQRNRTLKNSYVDVFNPSGAPMSKTPENVLAPAMPPAAVPQGGFFIPGAAPVAANNDAGGQYQPQQDVQQFYNPNQFGGGSGGVSY